MARQPKDEIDQFLLDNYQHHTDEQLMNKLHEMGLTIGIEAIRKRRKAMGAMKPTNTGSQYYKAQIERLGISDTDWKMAWDKSENLSVLVTNPYFQSNTFNTLQEELGELISSKAPKYPMLKRTKKKDTHNLSIAITDIHIGENTALTMQRALAGVEQAIEYSKQFNIDDIVFIGGNDIVHVDTYNRTTTKGTPLQSDGDPRELITIATDFYIDILQRLVPIANIKYMHVASNHDRVTGFSVSYAVQKAMQHCKHITWDVAPDDLIRKHIYGDILLTYAHGDDLKSNDAQSIISTMFREEWGNTKYAYLYLGHIHHNRSFSAPAINEKNGLEIHSLKSTQPRNTYEKKMGYLSKAGVSTFVHHPQEGQIARFNKNFM